MPPPPVLGGATQDAGTMTGASGGPGAVSVSGGARVGSKGATLDDLCRAVEELEKMENGSGGGGGGRREEDEDKRRPGEHPDPDPHQSVTGETSPGVESSVHPSSHPQPSSLHGHAGHSTRYNMFSSYNTVHIVFHGELSNILALQCLSSNNPWVSSVALTLP